MQLTSEALRELVRLLPIGIEAIFGSTPAQTSGPILVLLPPGPSTALPLLLLALSASASRPLVILSSPKLLISALEAKGERHPQPSVVVTHESVAEGVIEQVSELGRGICGVLVAGDTDKRLSSLARQAKGHGVTVGFWEDLWDMAEERGDLGITGAYTLPKADSGMAADSQLRTSRKPIPTSTRPARTGHPKCPVSRI